jgi:hypothetical protein
MQESCAMSKHKSVIVLVLLFAFLVFSIIDEIKCEREKKRQQVLYAATVKLYEAGKVDSKAFYRFREMTCRNKVTKSRFHQDAE